MPNKNLQLNDELSFLIACCQTNLSEDDIESIRSFLNTEQLDTQALLSLANQHGILPLVYKTLKKLHIDVQEDFHKDLKSSYTQIAQRNMLMSVELIRIMKLLEEHGIEALAFKGPVLSQMAYGDITLRQYNDLDILIKPNNLQQAISLLLEHNYKAAYPLPKLQLNSFLKLSHEFTLQNCTNHIVIELHWRLTSEDFLIKVDRLEFFEHFYFIKLNQREIKTCDIEKLFIYLAVHGTKHYWERFEWLVDIAYIIEKYPNLDWKRIIKLSKSIKAEKILFTTLYLSKELLYTPIPQHILNHFSEDKKLKKLSKKLLKDFIKNFENPSCTKIMSVVQFQLLEEKNSKLTYLQSFIQPTQLDYMMINIPEKLHFLYYFVRPINIFFRWLKK